MPEASVSRSPLIEWGVATLALPGEAQSGDRHLVKPVGSSVLVAVVDGLGHGAEAATAAQGGAVALGAGESGDTRRHRGLRAAAAAPDRPPCRSRRSAHLLHRRYPGGIRRRAVARGGAATP